MNKNSAYTLFMKRFLDVTLSMMAIILLSPVMVVTSVAILWKIGSPILFKQQRPGKDGKIFLMYKFRSMSSENNDKGILLSDEERLTKFGKLLRSTSLDELPELFNIIKGDMSIVGPRPLLVEYLPLYNEEQKKRHDTRPGLTGLAQVSGRNSISWEDKFKLDVEYVNKISFINDTKILLLTVKKVFKREGISSSTKVTVDKFEGNKHEEEK